MANGYIGKISALVTASTADLSRKLQGSTRDVNRFANSIQSQIATASRAAQSSLNGIFTPLQRIERALFAGRRLNLIDSSQVQQIQRAVSVAEGINKPLAAATRQFQGLSAEVQAQFLPALGLAQRRVAGLNDLLARSGNVSERAFGVTAERVERTAQAVQRLAQAQRAASAGFTGNELEFTNPRALEAINAAAAASQRAAALPASQRQDPAIAERVRQLQQFRNAVAQGVAEVEGLRLRPGVDLSAINAAERRLENLVETTRRAKKEFDEATGGDVEALISRERGSKQVEDKLAADAKSRADAEIALLIKKERGNKQIEDQLAADARSRQDAEIAALIRKEQAQKRLADEQANQDPAERVRRRVQAEDLARQRREEELVALRGQNTPIPRGRQGRARILSSLGSEISGVEQRVRDLPDVLRSQLGPEVDGLKNKFRLLARDGVAFTAQEADKLAAKAREITAALSSRQARGKQFLQAFGGAGEAGINLGIDERQLRGIEAEFGFLQDRLAGVSAETRGPLISAMENYRQVVNRAFREGTVSTAQGKKAIADARAEVVKLASEVLRVKPAQLAADLKKVGDISRGSFGNAGLAVQQAAFAIDDFFSVTGGLDQRVRAAGNNISQLGFILGGTAGLIAGIAASITSQLVVALVKWSNAGTETEDRVKSLNDSLTRQKSLVESLADAYRSVGESIEESGLSDQTRQARSRERTIDDLRRQQDAQFRERVAALDPTVQRERAIQAARQKELEAADSGGERARLEREIRASRDRERAAADAAVSRPAIAPEQAVQAVADSLLRAERAAIESRARAAGAAGGGGPGSEAAARAAEITRQRELEAAERRRDEFVAAGIGRVGGAQGARAQAAEARKIIDEAQSQIADSITTGFVGLFDGANDARRTELARLEEQRAQLEKDIFLAATNEVAIEATKTAIEASSAIGDAIKVLSGAIGGRASAVQDELERLTKTIAAAEGRLATAQGEGNVAAAEAAKAEIDAANSQKDAAISAARSVAAFSFALDRAAGQLFETAAGDARGAADQSRREANRLLGLAARDLAIPRDADFAGRQRRRQEENAAGIEDRAARLRDSQRVLRVGFERDAAAGRLGDEAAGLIRQRDAALSVLNNRQSSAFDRSAAEEAVAEAGRRLQRLFESLPQVQRLAGLADNLDAATQAAIAFAEAIAEGRRLVLTDAQRAADDFIVQVQKINAALAAGEINQGQRDAAIARIRQDGLRQLAPTIFALADQVATAVIQGPSRAALNATDVSTVEGSRELNRLLRGEDSARDQPLLELQREANKLLERVARGVENNEAQVAN